MVPGGSLHICIQKIHAAHSCCGSDNCNAGGHTCSDTPAGINEMPCCLDVDLPDAPANPVDQSQYKVFQPFISTVFFNSTDQALGYAARQQNRYHNANPPVSVDILDKTCRINC